MEGIRDRMSKTEGPSYVKYALADSLIIMMCGVLCGLDAPEDLVVCARSKVDFPSRKHRTISASPYF